MSRHYTRLCNFYYGNSSKKLVNKNKTIPLNGIKEISFDQIEIITRNSKKKIFVNQIKYLPKLIKRKINSRIANKLIANVTGLKLHDYGCSLKAFKKEIIEDIKLYGELHRFLPVLANIEGARIKEIKVNHRSRQYGSSKYGIDRTFRVLMDLLTVWFMTKFLTRPMYGFGFVGIISIFISLAMSSYLIVLKIMGEDIGNRPLLMFALILGIAGVQLFSFGLLSELLIRTYHESQSRPIYRIRSINSAKQN